MVFTCVSQQRIENVSLEIVCTDDLMGAWPFNMQIKNKISLATFSREFLNNIIDNKTLKKTALFPTCEM